METKTSSSETFREPNQKTTSSASSKMVVEDASFGMFSGIRNTMMRSNNNKEKSDAASPTDTGRKNKKKNRRRNNRKGKSMTRATNIPNNNNNNHDTVPLSLPPTHPNTNTHATGMVSDAPLETTTGATQDNPTSTTVEGYSPFQQYLNQIENDFGVTSIESVGPNAATSTLGDFTEDGDDDEEEERKEEEVEEEEQDKQRIILPVSYLDPISKEEDVALSDLESFNNNSQQEKKENQNDDDNNNNQSVDFGNGSVSDMYAIAVMQYHPSESGTGGGAYYHDDDISTLGDESMIRRRTLWTDEHIPHKQPPVAVTTTTTTPGPQSSVKNATTTATKSRALQVFSASSKKKKSSPPKSQPEVDPGSAVKEIRINKSKSRSGHTFLQSFFSKSGSADDDDDGALAAADADRLTPMSADVYTTIGNDFKGDNDGDEEDPNGVEVPYDEEVEPSNRFPQRKKWLIIRCIVCLSIFLLIVAAVTLVLGILYVKGDSDATLFGSQSSSSSGSNENGSSDSVPADSFPPALAPTQTPDGPVPTVELTEPTIVPTQSSTDDDNDTSQVESTSVPNPPTSAPSADEEPVDDALTESPTAAARNEIKAHLDAILADIYDIPNNDWEDVISDSSIPRTIPRSLAYDWMIKDPFYWVYSNATIVQRWALAVFYHSTNGDQWDTEMFPVDFQLGKAPWLNYSSECDWESTNKGGVNGRICDTNGQLFALHVRNVGLNGTIPTELGLLSSLRLFLANGNPALHGTLPTELGMMSNLEKLQLSFNDVSGTIPTEIGVWTSLSVAGLGNNRLVGTLPTEMGLWTSLRTLGLQGNTLGGPLPSEIGRLDRLESLSMERNFFTGTIPRQWDNLWRLASFSIHDNEITGEMPDDVCYFDNLYDLKADCLREMYCWCCTECY